DQRRLIYLPVGVRRKPRERCRDLRDLLAVFIGASSSAIRANVLRRNGQSVPMKKEVRPTLA
ncbi:MAG: hypothetical protein ACF8CQ_01790, partial [Rhodopirellula sp. JB044]|uniref:hypothetical protein n=1 Tax=Rhodopirellula sp. JB044 TaxID=3342844 RepID=UPI00370CCBA7